MEDLFPGMTGILITTNDQEKLCVSEAYNVLNEVLTTHSIVAIHSVNDSACHAIHGHSRIWCGIYILNLGNYFLQYADQLYGPESPLLTEHSDDKDKDLNVETAIAREVQCLRGSECKPRRFQATNSGAKHVVFIRCHPPVVPEILVHHMLSDVMKTKVSKTR